MVSWKFARRTALALVVLAVAFLWVTDQGINASAADKTAVATSSASTAAPSTDATPTPDPAPGQAKKQALTSCTVNGQTFNPCPPALLKQALRQAARQNAPAQKKGVTAKFAGVSKGTATLSPLMVGNGLSATASMTPGAAPDYFGVANYANSPLPQVDAAGAIIPGTGLRKFVDTLPGICGVGYAWTANGANNLGQCIPLAAKDTSVTFASDPAAGSDFYRIGMREYNAQMHSDLPGPFNANTPGALGTKLRGYVQLDTTNTPTGTQQYLGPLIVAQRNRPVRVLFANLFTTNLNVPVDTTYMGAGLVSTNGFSAMSSEKRAVVHLHGGNTPWISDGTPHQWITPAGGDGQPASVGFQKGYSTHNVPDMTFLVPNTLSDGMTTDYWTNEQSGRLMFYHEHAYGTTRLGVYNGLAAGYLIVDPAEETALKTATAPGTIAFDASNNVDLVNSDLAHMIPLVIQDKTFVPDAGATGGQLAAQDPTWDLTRGSYGDLWFPHVYTPNQNPADLSGANGFGRWDWGPWFWPPQNPASLLAQAFACTSAAFPTPPALGPLMCPGVPFLGASKVPAAAAAGVPDTASGTPEAFMDTPVVNGTAYPSVTVDATAYRFQILNAANDRSLNLGIYIADPVTVSLTNGGTGYTVAPTVAIAGCGTTGTATATIDATGVVTGITTSGFANCVAPTVTITGTGTGATAIASANTDVHMVPAISAASGRALPNCAVSTSLSLMGGGQVSSTLTTPTALPAGCWPQYFSAQGYSAGTFGENGTLSWGNSDGRIGGVPDPTFAGPPIIQIGSEGGVLPQATVIPSTPVSFDYNKRSITVLNVLNHGLWMGPAERADIVVDFSAFAGKTLILYNDAPAPVPAGDPRLDYFTNDPDYSTSGGAPTTMAGYGPNMRTIMQINVNATGTATLVPATLTAAIPGIFTTQQDAPVVPESAYPVGHGNGPDNYIPIQATSVNAWVGAGIGAVTLTSGGAGYTATPTVVIAPPASGTTATATAVLAPTSVGSLALTAGGSGYTSAPTVTFSGTGTGATATATLAGRTVASVTVTKAGSGYTSAPTVTFSAAPAGGTTATGTAVVSNRKVTSVTITNAGAGYVTAPTVTFSGGGGSGATATSTLAPAAVASVTLTAGGTGYTAAPTVAFSGGGGSGAAAAATLTPTVVASITLTNAGTGYTGVPAVTISAPQTAGSTATAVASAPSVPLLPKAIQELFTLDYGRMNSTLGTEVPFTNFLTQTTIPYGYADPPTEIFKDGETQLWKITHNGVDTHFMHFHLFTVQVINRVGWDGAIKPPDPYELGWKDTVRMNPLEDIIVALRPMKQTLPFAVPSSNRPMDVVHPLGYTSAMTFTNVDPENNPATVTNANVNFGWEFVWHCHILGHEENDMMRAMILAVAPAQPTVTAVTGGSKGTIALSITGVVATPNVADPTGFTILRGTAAAGPFTAVGTVASSATGTASFTDTGLSSKKTYYYQVVANNVVGDTAVYAAPAVGYPNVSADSAPSATANAIAK